jgi:transketolase
VIDIFKGNDIEAIIAGMTDANLEQERKTSLCIVTYRDGNGVDFMMHSHGKAPNDAQLETAFAQNPETLGD